MGELAMATEMEFEQFLEKKNPTFAEVCVWATKLDEGFYLSPGRIRRFVQLAIRLIKNVLELITFESKLTDRDICNLATRHYAETKGVKDFAEARILIRGIFDEDSAPATIFAITEATDHLKIGMIPKETTLDQIIDMSYVACLRKKDSNRMREDLAELAKGAVKRIVSHSELMFLLRSLEPPDFRATLLGQWAALKKIQSITELNDICMELFRTGVEDEKDYLDLILISSLHISQSDQLSWLAFLRQLANRTVKGSTSRHYVNNLALAFQKSLLAEARRKELEEE